MLRSAIECQVEHLVLHDPRGIIKSHASHHIKFQQKLNRVINSKLRSLTLEDLARFSSHKNQTALCDTQPNKKQSNNTTNTLNSQLILL